jgi:hypothetical protein
MENITVARLLIETRFFDEAWWGAAEPLYLSVLSRHPGGPVGRIRGVRFEDIECRSESGIYIGGAPQEPSSIDEITLQNVSLKLIPSTRYPGNYVDLRPGAGETKYSRTPHTGCTIVDASRVRLVNCSIEGQVKTQRAPGFTQLPAV